MTEFLSMGKHTWYVWGAYALVFAVLVINYWLARLRHRRVYRDVEVRVRAVGDEQ